MRGMHTKETAQKIIEATRIHYNMRIHYNFCREHSGLGKTPAEEAGVKINIEGNKVEGLIRYAKAKALSISKVAQILQ